jgi:hypothetical protein
MLSRKDFITNQFKFCSAKKYPVYMPIDGYCFSCGADIPKEMMKYGQNGSEQLITACPVCHRSFCD